MKSKENDWMRLVEQRSTLLLSMGLEPGLASFLATNFLNHSEGVCLQLLSHFRRFEPPPNPANLFFSEQHSCFYNAARNAIYGDSSLLVVEGFSTKIIPMLHAWNLDPFKGEIRDSTWYNKPSETGGQDYFGVVIRPEFLEEHLVKCMDEGTYYSILDLTLFRANPPAEFSEMFFSANEALPSKA